MRGLGIEAVEPGSTADRWGLRAGDFLTAVDGEAVNDILDYYFLLAGGDVVLTFRRGNVEWNVPLTGNAPGGLGLRFSRPFGRIRRCNNRCVFCFVDQQPPGLRPSLNFKDDDYRLSFWEGNFVTLSNCTRADINRIVAQRLSPLYVSVHTTRPELRAKIMRNPRAGKIYEQLRMLARGEITLHTQVVLCPGLNDGEELTRTVSDLAGLYPAVRSVAVVPVGLTQHRKDLYPLEAVTRNEAETTLAFLKAVQKENLRRLGTRLVYAADEFYLLAGKPFPSAKEYEGFPQLENGVGLARRFIDAWRRVEKRLPPSAAPERAVIVTGALARVLLEPVVARLNLIEGLEVELLPVINSFFGPGVTVAGLLTGADVRQALDGITRPDLIIIPCVALNEGALFLDGVAVKDIAAAADCPVIPASGPRELVKALGLTVQRSKFNVQR